LEAITASLQNQREREREGKQLQRKTSFLGKKYKREYYIAKANILSNVYCSE